MVQNVHGLSLVDIKQECPSIFAVSKHESRTDRYTPIPTIDVVEALAETGFVPTLAVQTKVRDVTKVEFTKHLLRLRKREDLGYSKPDVHEVVLVNSADGECSYQLYGGIFRTVCTNGLITGDVDSTIRVSHRGDIVGRVVEGSLAIARESEQIAETIEEMKQVVLPREEQLLLAGHALKARYDGEETIYQPQDLLPTVRRREDGGNDLYTVLNVVQERVIKGGARRWNGETHKKMRAVNGIDKSVKLNQLVWAFSQELLKLHNKGGE